MKIESRLDRGVLCLDKCQRRKRGSTPGDRRHSLSWEVLWAPLHYANVSGLPGCWKQVDTWWRHSGTPTGHLTRPQAMRLHPTVLFPHTLNIKVVTTSKESNLFTHLRSSFPLFSAVRRCGSWFPGQLVFLCSVCYIADTLLATSIMAAPLIPYPGSHACTGNHCHCLPSLCCMKSLKCRPETKLVHSFLICLLQS